MGRYYYNKKEVDLKVAIQESVWEFNSLKERMLEYRVELHEIELSFAKDFNEDPWLFMRDVVSFRNIRSLVYGIVDILEEEVLDAIYEAHPSVDNSIIIETRKMFDDLCRDTKKFVLGSLLQSEDVFSNRNLWFVPPPPYWPTRAP
jgi:hypothetical protein